MDQDIKAGTPSEEAGTDCERCGGTGSIGHSQGLDGEAYEIDCPACHPDAPAPVPGLPSSDPLLGEMAEALEKIANHFDMDGEGDKGIVKMYADWKGLALEMAETARAALKKYEARHAQP
jgi:hypothetical protein